MKKLKSFLSKPSVRDIMNALPIFTIVFITVFMIVEVLICLDPTRYKDGIFLGFKEYSAGYMAGDEPYSPLLTFTVIEYYETYLFLIIPFLTGLSQFMFLHNKNSCYSLFSFPVSKKTVFNNRVTLPFAAFVVITLVIKLIALDQNIMLYGFSVKLLLYWFSHIFRLLSIALLGYATAVVFSILCGKTLEAAIAGVSLHLFPWALYLFDSPTL